MSDAHEQKQLDGLYEDWEAMSRRYLPGRVDLLASMTAVLTELDARVIVDLGCGPATVATMLTERLPSAHLIGVDHDPVLLALAQGLATRNRRLRIVEERIDGDWPTTVGQRPDAVITVLVLHYFAEALWPALPRQIADGLSPGGVFVNVDVFADLAEPGHDDRMTVTKVGPSADEPPRWEEWWRRLEDSTDPEIVKARRVRSETVSPSAEFNPNLDSYRMMLTAAGFSSIDVAGRRGTAHVATAIK